MEADVAGAGLALEVSGASKTFGHQRVLRAVNMQVRAGEIRALVGENGSGKSTLVKILAGYHLADPGMVMKVGGRPIEPHHAGVSDSAGLRFVHQDLALVDDLTTVENLGLGRGYGKRVGRPIQWAKRRDEADEIMRGLGYDIDVDLPIRSLEASERTAVAVARAISPHRSSPQMLVLDEPTANLPGSEVERLFALIRRLRDSGLGILFVSHHLNEVFDLADSVTVLRGGSLVTTRPTADLDEGSLIELMVGHRVTRSVAQTGTNASEVALTVTGIAGGTLGGIDLTIAKGEIVGVAGITGSGREAFAPLVFGADDRRGIVAIGGDRVRPGRPDLSIGAGMVLIPSDRERTAILQGHDVAENISIARPQDFVRHRVLRRSVEARVVGEWLQHLDVRPSQPRALLSQLSGGNAQKVILARWLRLQPRVLLMDEPTQGVDVGAKEDIHRRVELAAADGCAVVVCSTDNEELARLCHRVIVLVRGRIAHELRAPLTSDEITVASLAEPKGTPT